ncbi:MAG: addiction module protein [Bacteroidetes bacterium]|nr:addiction module protein [Bacteroidota bacterium]
MPASPNIYLPLNFNQLFELVKQLPAKEKQQLIGLLTQEQEDPIPEWQKKEVRKRIREVQKNPNKAVSWEAAQKKIKQLAK